MKVLNCCKRDWANFSHENANALRSIGVYCVDVKEYPHKYSYKTESIVLNSSQIIEQMMMCDIIQIMHSDERMLKLAKIAGKKSDEIIVWHTGTNYRQNSKELDSIFNPNVRFCITDQCEFMFLGGKNIKYVATAINTDWIMSTIELKEKDIILAHYPSKSEVKGSKSIVDIVTRVYNTYPNFAFKYSELSVPHETQIERMRNCDVYIEMFKPTQNGNPYGCYGVTAFEAAALGKLVITQNIYPNVYTDSYNCETEFVICNTKDKLRETIDNVVRINGDELYKKRMRTQKWLQENHSYKATGKKMKKILEV